MEQKTSPQLEFERLLASNRRLFAEIERKYGPMLRKLMNKLDKII